jgi:heme exporter protein B
MNAPPLHAFVAVLKRDLLVGARHRVELANPLAVCLIVVALFAFSVGADRPQPAEFAAAVVWVAALLASMLSLEQILGGDYQDGTLEQLLLSAQPLPLLIGAKVLAHWLLYGVPLLFTALLLTLLLQLPVAALPVMLATLLLGTPVLSLLGAALVALTVGLRGSGVLLALLTLPLCIPVLIFAVAAVDNTLHGLPPAGELWFLGGVLMLAITVLPLAAAASLRIRLG